MPNNLHRPLESRRLTLQSDLDQFERGDHNGFRCTGCTTGENGEGLCVFGPAVVGDDPAPVAYIVSEPV